MSRSCFASFPVCVYKFSSHYLKKIIFIDNRLGPLATEPPCTNQPDALISQIYFWNKTLRVSDSSSAHHQEFFTVHTAKELSETGRVLFQK